MAFTTEHKDGSPERRGEPTAADRRAAAELVDEADRLVADVLVPGEWPESETVERFMAEGRLERLLSLYARAMALDSSEPAYPWNLSSVLRRLGQLELSHAYLTRAIRLGEEQGDSDYAGADAYLALAEISIDSGDEDQALVALARAREAAGGREDVKAHSEELLVELSGPGHRGGRPLAELLAQLPA